MTWPRRAWAWLNDVRAVVPVDVTYLAWVDGGGQYADSKLPPGGMLIRDFEVVPPPRPSWRWHRRVGAALVRVDVDVPLRWQPAWRTLIEVKHDGRDLFVHPVPLALLAPTGGVAGIGVLRAFVITRPLAIRATIPGLAGTLAYLLLGGRVAARVGGRAAADPARPSPFCLADLAALASAPTPRPRKPRARRHDGPDGSLRATFTADELRAAVDQPDRRSRARTAHNRKRNLT